MQLLSKISWIRVTAMVACLLALGVYITFMPNRKLAVEAASCTCGGGMDQQCSGGQRCICLSTNGQCTGCQWSNDRFCPVCGVDGDY
jgi:hypothetical protein